MVKTIKHFLTKIYIRLHEHRHEGRLKYLLKRNHSDTLIVCFSGFAEKPAYNYVRTLQNIKADKMFILDDFGFKGSYYWYENGNDKPMRLVKSLIANKLNKGGGYKRLITLGSSKGGTCAIYYGLIFGATDIYAGACQYRVGSYLNAEDRVPVFKAMMGAEAGKTEQERLDEVMPNHIYSHKDSSSVVHLLYSKEEHTYQDDIQYLINDLEKANIRYIEKIESFSEHSEVGKYFSPWIKKELSHIISNG